MKIFGLALAFSATGYGALASETPKVEMQPLQGKNALIRIEQTNSPYVEIVIKNKAGEVVYYSETEGNMAKYQHIYDFSEYKPGVYDLIVTADSAVTESRFTVAADKVNIGDQQQAQQPFFVYNADNSILRVAYLNYPGDKVNLRVYEGGELIYSKSLSQSFAVSEGLNLSKLAAGRYRVVLAAGNKDYNYPVVIR